MKNTGLPLFVDAKILFKPFSSCSLLLQITGPVVVGPPEFYRSAHNGDDWSYLSTILDHYPGPFAIDPEEPSLVYTALFNYNMYYYDFYFSVDYCHVWIQDSKGLPDTRIWDLEVDPNAPEYLYAGTDSGVYYYDPGFKNKHLTSSSDTATAYNSSRHLLRVHGTNEFWITYESGGAIYVVHSTDEGQTWSRKVEIGEGYNPTISMRDVPEYPPCIVWRTITGQDTIYFARYISEEKWTAPTAIVTSQTGVDFGPPSFVIGTNNYGHVVYSDGTNAYYTQFYIYNPEPGIPEEIGSGENPSIGFMNPGGSHPEIHIVWEDNNKIRYCSRTMSGIWGNQETVSTNNSNHPSVEVSGTDVYVIWERFGDIEYCYAVYTNGSHYWSKIGDFESDYKLDYPVFTGGNAMSCVADVDGNYEIYFWYNTGAGWVGPINISNSTQYSHYPHIVHKQTVLGTIIYFTWTEKDNAPFDVMFENYNLGGSNPDEDLAFYIADGGEQDASPFNLRREGYLQYGPEPYKRIDYDAEYLEYQFANLNPRRLYGLGAYLYQHGHPNLPISAEVDNYQTGAISLPPDTLIILRHMLPTMLYEDSTINVKIFGNNAVSAALVIYEYENDSIGGGGPQSYHNDKLESKNQLVLQPNPFNNSVEIRLQSISDINSRASLNIYDASGRLVKRYGQLTHQSTIIWDGYDDTGKRLPNGIYFIELKSGTKSITENVVMLR